MNWLSLHSDLWRNHWSRTEKVKVTLLAFARIAVGGLDAVGLALTGLVVSVVSGTSLDTKSLTGSLIAQVEKLAPGRAVLVLAITALAFFLVKAFLSLLLNRVTAMQLANLELTSANRLFTRLLALQRGDLSTWTRPELVHGVTSSVRAATSESLMAIFGLLAEVSVVMSVALYLLLTNLFVFCSLLVYFALVMGLLHWFATVRSARFALESHEATMESQSVILEALQNYRYIFTSKNSSYHERSFNRERGKMAEASAKYQVATTVPRYVIELALMLGISALMFVNFSFPEFGITAAVVTIFLVGVFRLFGSLLPMQGYVATLRRIRNEAKVMIEVNKLPHMHGTDASRISFGYDLVMTGVAYRHRDSQEMLFSDINLTVPEGSFLAITGASGAGKSTLVDVAVGILPCTNGEVKIGGLPPELFELENPGAVAYVEQMPSIIRGSITENVTFGREVNRLQVLKVLELVGLERFANDANSRGIIDTLSGGETQRVALARALYGNPKILVLDEPTSALDIVSTNEIVNALKAMRGKMTIIAISHTSKLSSVADTIFNLETKLLK